MDKIKTGISGLDVMLHGGLIPKRAYIVSGPNGSGKTTLCMQFLLEGLTQNENVLFIAIDEPPNEVKQNSESFGWDIDKVRILDATPDIKAYSKTKSVKELSASMEIRKMGEVTDIRKSKTTRVHEVSIYSIQQMLKKEIRDFFEATGGRYSRLVIDSMTGLKLFGMKGFEMRGAIQSFMRFLSELELTVLIATDIPNPEALDTEFLLSRGEIRLHKWRDGITTKRGVTIEKYMGSSHDIYLRPLEITDNGIVIDTRKKLTVKDTKVRRISK